MPAAGSADERLYRPGVGLYLFDSRGLVFVGERADMPGAWQMPQGGIDEGETPAMAAMRELAEEVGTGRAEIVAEAPDWHSYDLPPRLAGLLWGGR
ncbi:MAG: NUDIX domain-containing protein, partial [Alphaproteobacteria bacterium]